MLEFLNYTFEDSETFVQTYDELPLWSASFGLLLFKHLELKPNLTVIDIGSGTGFPLLELASRLGQSCKLYGVDPWENANKRIAIKIKNYGLNNVEIINNSAEKLSFEDNSIDLIVSNLGINNFDNPQLVFKECQRVLTPNGRLVLTTNLDGHWREFYQIFETTLHELGQGEIVKKIKKQQKKRGTINSISKLFLDNGFTINQKHKEKFEMRFLDGSAFLNHHFVKLGWLASWKNLISDRELEQVFKALEDNLNRYSKQSNGLKLTVPMAYIEGKKV
jgi:arsenite methyltransferase